MKIKYERPVLYSLEREGPWAEGAACTTGANAADCKLGQAASGSLGCHNGQAAGLCTTGSVAGSCANGQQK